MNKSKKFVNLLATILTVILAMISLSGCIRGVVSENQYKELFAGVVAQDESGNTIYYEMKTLVDNIKFNSSLQSKPYCKLDIYILESCQIRGTVFLIRSSENCTLKFTTFIDGEIKVTKTKTISANSNCDIDLFFDNSKLCNAKSDFYIEIEELGKQKDEQKTNFMFDSLIIFLEEQE